MPEFLFAANDSTGKNVQGKATADDMSAAVAYVTSLGYSLLHIELIGEVSLPGQPTPATQSESLQQQYAPAQQPVKVEAVESKPADILKSDVETRRKLERELAGMGMSPDEITRLINANANTTEADSSLPVPRLADTGAKAPIPVKAPPVNTKSGRVTAASLESFAAELTSSNAAKSKQQVREVDLKLPEFRDSSTAEVIQAETLLRDASMLRRREKFREAEEKVRGAILLTPRDASALELLGDILQGVARVDEALAAYKRATEADPKRSSAERKYGDLLMRQQNWSFADPEAVAPNRWINSILSLCVPGVGQVYNGDWVKAGAFFVIDLLCLYMLFYSPWAVSTKGSKLNAVTSVALGMTIVTYVAAMIDSNVVAARKRRD